MQNVEAFFVFQFEVDVVASNQHVHDVLAVASESVV